MLGVNLASLQALFLSTNEAETTHTIFLSTNEVKELEKLPVSPPLHPITGLPMTVEQCLALPEAAWRSASHGRGHMQQGGCNGNQGGQHHQAACLALPPPPLPTRPPQPSGSHGSTLQQQQQPQGSRKRKAGQMNEEPTCGPVPQREDSLARNNCCADVPLMQGLVGKEGEVACPNMDLACLYAQWSN